MGKLALLILIIFTAYMLWQAFAPTTWRLPFGPGSNRKSINQPPRGPDDDPDFLWNLKKEAHKKRRNKNGNAQQDDQDDQGSGEPGDSGNADGADGSEE